jgi:hypothetical protein
MFNFMFIAILSSREKIENLAHWFQNQDSHLQLCQIGRDQDDQIININKSGSIPTAKSSVVLRWHLTLIYSIVIAAERKEIISFHL